MSRVVIIGGGFGGLSAARSLQYAPVQVTLIDRRNFHLFQPLLYQVATGWLSPADIASPLRAVLKRQRNVQVLLAEATDIDVTNRRVTLTDGEVSYDTLIVATGARHHYFGNTQWNNLLRASRPSKMPRISVGAYCWPLKPLSVNPILNEDEAG